MRILSKFKDFYDCGVAFGMDPTLLFLREESELKSEDAPQFPFYSINEYGSGASKTMNRLESFWVGFCGKWYFGVKYREEKKPYEVAYGPIKFAYGSEARQLVDDHCDKPWSWGKGKSYNSKTIESYEGTGYLEKFVKNNCAILLLTKDWHARKFTKNPKLADYQFAKVKHPMEAFQELEMFLTNELARQVDPPQLDDKGRILAHGFDLKTSFRKDTPPTRKQK